MTRAEHLEGCKRRALEYLDAGDPSRAVDSMMSDLRNHAETKELERTWVGVLSRLTGRLSRPEDVRYWIEGF